MLKIGVEIRLRGLPHMPGFCRVVEIRERHFRVACSDSKRVSDNLLLEPITHFCLAKRDQGATWDFRA